MNRVNLISNSRNGSSYLYSVITAYHSYDLKISEPFGDNRFEDSGIKDQKCFLHNQVEKIKNSQLTILKNHTYHLDLIFDHGFWDYFGVNSFYNIVLYRKNIFESSLSLALALETGMWSSYKNYPQSITVNEDIFKTCIAQQYNGLLWFLHNSKQIRFDCVMSYEELCYSPLDDYNRLKIGQATVESDSKQQKAPSKSSVVNNYETLRSICYDECDKRNNLTFENFLLQDVIS